MKGNSEKKSVQKKIAEMECFNDEILHNSELLWNRLSDKLQNKPTRKITFFPMLAAASIVFVIIVSCLFLNNKHSSVSIDSLDQSAQAKEAGSPIAQSKNILQEKIKDTVSVSARGLSRKKIKVRQSTILSSDTVIQNLASKSNIPEQPGLFCEPEVNLACYGDSNKMYPPAYLTL